MLGFICDWCGKAYTDYPLWDQGTTLASVPKIREAKDDDPVEIPNGTKVISDGWTTSISAIRHSIVRYDVCPDCYEAYKKFIKSRRKGDK